MSVEVSTGARSRLPVRDGTGSAVFWQIITVLGLLIMRVLWSGAIFVLLTGRQIEDARLRSVVMFTAIALFVYFVAFALSYLQLRESVIRVILISLFILGFIVSLRFLLFPNFQGSWIALINRYLEGFADISFLLRPEFLTTLLIFLLWRRSLNASRQWIGPVVVGREMRIGMVMFLVLGFLGSRTNGFLPGVETVLFLFISLITMGSARISSLSYLRGGRGIPFERNWAVGVVLIAGGLMIGAFLLGSLGGGPVATLLDAFLSFTYNLFLRFILVLLSPIVYVIAQIAVWVMGRFEFLVNPDLNLEVMSLQEDLQLELEQRAEEVVASSSSNDLAIILRLVAITLGIIVLSLLLVHTARQMRLRRQAMAGEDQDRDSLISMLPQALADVFRRGAEELAERLRRLSPRRRILAAERIRRIYADLMLLSERLGSPRPKAYTPYEYLKQLNHQFPGSGEDLDLITQAYVRIRYGQLPESSKEVQDIEEAWARLQVFGRELARRQS